MGSSEQRKSHKHKRSKHSHKHKHHRRRHHRKPSEKSIEDVRLESAVKGVDGLEMRGVELLMTAELLTRLERSVMREEEDGDSVDSDDIVSGNGMAMEQECVGLPSTGVESCDGSCHKVSGSNVLPSYTQSLQQGSGAGHSLSSCISNPEVSSSIPEAPFHSNSQTQNKSTKTISINIHTERLKTLLGGDASNPLLVEDLKTMANCKEKEDPLTESSILSDSNSRADTEKMSSSRRSRSADSYKSSSKRKRCHRSRSRSQSRRYSRRSDSHSRSRHSETRSRRHHHSSPYSRHHHSSPSNRHQHSSSSNRRHHSSPFNKHHSKTKSKRSRYRSSSSEQRSSGHDHDRRSPTRRRRRRHSRRYSRSHSGSRCSQSDSHSREATPMKPVPQTVVMETVSKIAREIVTNKKQVEINKLTSFFQQLQEKQANEDIYGIVETESSKEIRAPFEVKPAPVYEPRRVLLDNPWSNHVPSESANALVMKPVEQVFPVSTGVRHAVVQTSTNEAEEVFDQSQSVPVGDLVVKRLEATRRLHQNPLDSEAYVALAMIEQQTKAWAQSKVKPGQFTGEQHLNPLTKEDHQTGMQTWAKKRMFYDLAPVVGGFGLKMLKKMGWREGQALGNKGQGVLEPIALDIKTNRSGLKTSSDSNRQPMTSGSSKSKQSTSQDIMGKHPVSALQEICQKRHWNNPDYQLVTSSPFLFKVVLPLGSYQPLSGSNIKKDAKCQAAACTLHGLGLVEKTIEYMYSAL